MCLHFVIFVSFMGVGVVGCGAVLCCVFSFKKNVIRIVHCVYRATRPNCGPLCVRCACAMRRVCGNITQKPVAEATRHAWYNNVGVNSGQRLQTAAVSSVRDENLL